MKKRQANEVLLSLGTLCILGDEKAKATAPEQSVSIRVILSCTAVGSYFSPTLLSFPQHDRNKKKKQQKPKKKKDRRLIEDGIRRVRSPCIAVLAMN